MKCAERSRFGSHRSLTATNCKLAFLQLKHETGKHNDPCKYLLPRSKFEVA